MKLTCPSCGATHSAEAWVNDANTRQAIGMICEMPQSVARYTLTYLSLFRPVRSGRGMSWAKALRLIGELKDLVAAGTIQRGRRPARDCPPHIWAQALEKITDRPPSRLPLTSHGYLMEIAYDLADTADRKAEVRRNQAERSGGLRPQRPNMEKPEKLDPDWMKQITSKLKRKVRGEKP